MTEYLVLVREKTSTYWVPIGNVSARSARSAIRERIDGAAQSDEYRGEGEYVAVPARSWQPVTVKTETKTQLRFS